MTEKCPKCGEPQEPEGKYVHNINCEICQRCGYNGRLGVKTGGTHMGGGTKGLFLMEF